MSDVIEKAQQWMRGVYGANPEVVDELAAENVVLSYPVFQQVLGTSAVRGKDAVREFVLRFGSRFKEGQITFHQAVSESDYVVLIWSFQARQTFDEQQPELQRWGGITCIRFDETGRVVLELGEESSPGPMARIS